jgi:hypothetical protein
MTDPLLTAVKPFTTKSNVGQWGFSGKRIWFLVLLGLTLLPLRSQVIDNFSGRLTLTNNGISPIPSFSLGDPALIVYMRMARKKWSFEPEFRINVLNANPWSLDFPVIYRAVDDENFRFTLGLEPSMNFQLTEIPLDNGTQTLFEARKYLAVEIGPTLKISRHWETGFFYLGALGFDSGPKNIHYISFGTSVMDVRLFRSLLWSISPQVFHLKVDENNGNYFSMTSSVRIDQTPWVVSGLINKNLGSEIAPEQNVIWSISLTYIVE